MWNTSRKLMAAVIMITLYALMGIRYSFAEVLLDLKDPTVPSLFVYGTISKSDADYVARREDDFKNLRLLVYLNSSAGNDDAAMEIGRIIRNNEAFVKTQNNAKCFGSCVLIYIAGARRSNTNGLIGLHRPFAADAQRIKDYVREMGVSDAFYDAMVNPEASDIRVYRGHEINILIPEIDPITDEIDNAYDARKYGVTAAEMRDRKSIAQQKCTLRYFTCQQAIYWGLDIATY